MDPLDFLTHEQMIGFFHRNKTKLSSMEKPNTFLSQLRDHDLVTEEFYQKVIKMKSTSKIQEGVYKILDVVEKEHGDSIKKFWNCVFKDHMLNKYPDLHSIRRSLLNESCGDKKRPDAEKPSRNEDAEKMIIKSEQKSLPEEKKIRKERNEVKPGPSSASSQKKPTMKPKSCSDNKKRPGTKKLSRNEDTEKKRKKPVQKKKSLPEEKKIRKKRNEVKPGPSSGSSKKKTGPSSSSSQKKPAIKLGLPKLRNNETLPVTCGEKEGVLYPDKLSRGQECIFSEGCWFTPGKFEIFSGKGSNKNWKWSIRYKNFSLQKLIKEGRLQCRTTNRTPRKKKNKNLKLSCVESSIFERMGSSEESMEEEIREQLMEQEESEVVDMALFASAVLSVSCGSVSGDLYKSRFVGPHTKSIRTEERWFTPVEFVKQDGHWRKDILCHGKTLNLLVKKNILSLHSMLCPCRICNPKNKQDQDNDDVCYICNSGLRLVCCDECPRAFHRQCHLPTLQADTLGDKWMCTFCVLKSNHSLWIHMSSELALKSPVSGNTMRCDYLLLRLFKADTQHVFTYNPAKKIEKYNFVISKPMWLKRVRNKLQKKKYKSVGAFVRDIELIFSNYQTFNQDSGSARIGAEMKELFQKEFNAVFKIQ